MALETEAAHTLSPWWRRGVLICLVTGFAILIWVATLSYTDAPPVPEKIVDPSGRTIIMAEDIRAGQQVFLKYALMENGSLWGHGAYLGPDFAALYLHRLALDARAGLALSIFKRPWDELNPLEQAAVDAGIPGLLKRNRYDLQTKTLDFSQAEADSFHSQIGAWTDYFSQPAQNRVLPERYIDNPDELKQLTAFFAWAAWASAANRPGAAHSYTNNFPYDPLAGNRPDGNAIFWSALSLITLLAGTAAVLFAFGRFNYLGWHGEEDHIHPMMLPGIVTPGQKAAVKFFGAVMLLFFLQVLVGAAVAHGRAEPGSFYGFDLYRYFPGTILRTWHLQTVVFWIATAFIAGGLVLASALGEAEPRGQAVGVNVLFWSLAAIVGGSLLGEILGINRLLGNLWFWLGHQGWEYLDLGRAWQILLAIGLVFWVWLLYRAARPALKDPERREITVLFMLTAMTIPVFYLPAFFFGSTTNYTVVDNWRFWIIHLWVEGFFELFVTVMVAVTFYRLGLVARLTVLRVIYLDAILFLGSGIVGTGHHWYWTGQTTVSMALSAMYSAMEVVPLTLLTLDAWNFIKLSRSHCDTCGKSVDIPHKWTFYFLMAVGFWNFVGAGIFGFLINLPIVSYFEVGTILTPLHGHTALMGAFGMEAMALLVLTFRQVLPDAQWRRPEKFIKISFWGLNIGLALMVVGNLFPAGVSQFYDVLANGYWHARGPEYLDQEFVKLLEWCRMPGDLVFIFLGVVPMLPVAWIAYHHVRKPEAIPADLPAGQS